MKRLFFFNPNVIYFARLENGLIKIGFTLKLSARMRQLRNRFRQPVKLLGAMPGGPKVERQTHKQFASLAQGNELFRADPSLLEFIEINTLIPEGWSDYEGRCRSSEVNARCAKGELVPMTIWIPAVLRRELKVSAIRTEKTISDIVVAALDRAFEEAESTS